MIGEKIGPFRIEEKVGAGAMGVVYRAVYEPTGQQVALKVVSSEVAQRGNSAERFERESDILKQFRHPNIVLHIGTGFSRSRDLRYYAMEFVPGSTLDAVLADEGAMPWQKVVHLGIQICDALQYAHERGVVHRDLKPSNLMVTESGTLKLTDFGIAKDLDRTALTADGRTLGTAAYMAPEQIRGTPTVSHKTDLYALGCVLFQMLTGRPPFEGRSALQLMHKHLDEAPPRPSKVNPEVPKALDRLVQSLMAKSSDDRPWDAQAVAQQFRELEQKEQRGEAVSMAYGDVPANPTRAGEPVVSGLENTSAGASTRSVTGTRKSGTRRRKTERGPTDLPTVRSRIEVGLLVAGLLGITGLLVYQFWPPSAAYYYRKAGEGMQSAARADRLKARDSYMATLDRKFPDHPYAEPLRAWRDDLLLEDAERKANFLENPSALSASKPTGAAETAYVDVYRAATQALSTGRDQDALASWLELQAQLERLAQQSGEEADRQWFVLARKRAADLSNEVESRTMAARKLAEKVVSQTAQARLQNQPPPLEENERDCREIVRRFEAYQSCAEWVDFARGQITAITGTRLPVESDSPLESPPPAQGP